MNITRPTVLEVNLDNFKYNISKIKEVVGEDVTIMPVVKANGYGTYINKCIDILNDFDIVAVANIDEGIDLRNIGYEKEIFVLNQPYISEIDKIINNNITVGVCDLDFLNKINDKVRIHLEIETGMGRTGINPNELESFINNIPSNVIVEGVYTHFSSADNDLDYTRRQIELFNKSVDIVKSKFDIKYIHASASNGILNYREAYYNMVRPGIIMYGYPSSDDTYSMIDLRPIASLKSKVTFIKEVDEGTSISYNRKYITDRKSVIATIPIGYADGMKRSLSNEGYVYINGNKAPIVGNICMDSFMVDVTDIDVKVGDEVIIFDNKNITLEEIASKCNTINYEILSTIGDRVPRIFISEVII